MAFRISLSKAQQGSKTKAEEEAKAREEKNALDKVMADLIDEHGDDTGVLGELEKSVDAEEDVFVPTGAKRHFTGRPKSMKSGPGTLAPEPGAPFPRPGGPGGPSGYIGQTPRFGGSVPRGPAALGGLEENVYGSVVAKASNLPPAMDTRRVEGLFSDFPSLKVTRVERLPPSRPSSPSHASRPSATMKIIFDKDANARDLDDAMNKMNDKRYLGKGYYLHLDRYLGGQSISTKQHEEPFGATLHDAEVVSKGYAPPPDLGGHNRDRREEMNKRMLVTASAPPDAATTRLIHRTIEGVIEGGLEFEAALMQDPQVQEEERFAWLFDQNHPLNRYYRWRLHEIINSSARPRVFERQPDWKGPKEALTDEYASELWDLSQPQEQSDSEDEEPERPARITIPVGENYPGRSDMGYGLLSPRSRTLLIWLLASVPPSSALYDEIAAFSVFAVDHVSKGMDEVVQLLVTNIFQPFFFSKANPKYRPDENDEEAETRKRSQLPQLTTNGLRIISDVALTTSKESGVCYKYRTVIANQLVDRKVFEYLETLPSKLSMGRLKEIQYREDINGILKVWTDEVLFEKDILDHLDHAFNARQRQKDEEERERKLAERRLQKKSLAKKTAETGNNEDDDKMDIDGDGARVGSAMDGTNDEKEVPVTDRPASPPEPTPPAPMGDTVMKEYTAKESAPDEIPGESAVARARRLRPKAEDMFASDGE